MDLNPKFTCPIIDGSYMFLSNLEFTCNNSPYINLDAAVLRRRLLDTGVAATTLAAGATVPTANSLPNIGTSSWVFKGIASTTPTAVIKVGADGMPAFSALHAMSSSPAWWVSSSGAGATIAVVAKLPATSVTASQVLLDFSPLFTMAREGSGGDLSIIVSGSKALVKAALDAKWHSYVAVSTATSTTLYVDNVKRVALTHASIADKAATAHYLGASAKAPAAMLNGEVRQVMAWRRVLPVGELGSLHNQMRSKWKLP